MKKYLKLSGMAAVVLCIILVLAACGTDGEKPDDKTTQTGGNAQNEPTIEVGTDLKWPKDKMGNLPEPKCKITAVTDDKSTNQCVVTFGEMTKQDAESYAQKLKELGYTGGLSLTDQDVISVSGEKADGSKADFVYNVTAKEGVISFRADDATQSKTSSGETGSSETLDMSDLAPWPSDFIASVPEPKGKIINIVENDASVTVDLQYADKADFQNYIKSLKDNGFKVDVNETSGLNEIDFRAYNDGGDWVHAYWAAAEGKNTATVMMEKAE